MKETLADRKKYLESLYSDISHQYYLAVKVDERLYFKYELDKLEEDLSTLENQDITESGEKNYPIRDLNIKSAIEKYLILSKNMDFESRIDEKLRIGFFLRDIEQSLIDKGITERHIYNIKNYRINNLNKKIDLISQYIKEAKLSAEYLLYYHFVLEKTKSELNDLENIFNKNYLNYNFPYKNKFKGYVDKIIKNFINIVDKYDFEVEPIEKMRLIKILKISARRLLEVGLSDHILNEINNFRKNRLEQKQIVIHEYLTYEIYIEEKLRLEEVLREIQEDVKKVELIFKEDFLIEDYSGENSIQELREGLERTYRYHDLETRVRSRYLYRSIISDLESRLKSINEEEYTSFIKNRTKDYTAFNNTLSLVPPTFPHIWASAYGQDQYGLWQALTLKKPPHLIKGQDKSRYGDSTEVRYVFRWIPAGTFWMGSPDDEKGRYENEDYHSVTLSKGFWLGETPVTQALYEVITGHNPSHFKGDELLPVEQVSWDNAQAFIKQMNSLHPDLKVRLPWEAEWEYACRAGTTTAFNNGNEISLDLANYRGTWEDKDQWGEGAKRATTPVKSYPCNAGGLYDMHGNVWEWCEDFYTEKLGKDSIIDPMPALAQSSTSKTLHIMRGGSWNSRGRRLRSAMRDRETLDYKDGRIGFRLAF